MLQISSATKYYDQTIALNGADFTLNKGEVAGLFGENGAGKSTLLKAMMGLCRLNSGTVTLDKEDLCPKSYERLSFITEEGSYFPSLTPLEHGMFYGDILPRFRSKRFLALLNFFALPDTKARKLSKGQRMKLDIAVGMSRGAEFILMDEPFVGKDIFTRRDFLQLMITMLEPEEGVVIATHQIMEIEMFITRAAILKTGRFNGNETMETIANQGETLTSFIKKAYGYDEGRMARFMESQEVTSIDN